MPQMLTIRRAKNRSDLEEIEKFAYEFHAEFFFDLISDEQVKYMLEIMYKHAIFDDDISEGAVYERAFVGDRMIGVCAFGADSNPEALLLHRFVLNPNYRGAGYGHEMVQHIVAFAGKIGRHALNVRIGESNHRAQQIYEHMGFRVQGAPIVVDDEDVDGAGDCIMTLDIDTYRSNKSD